MSDKWFWIGVFGILGLLLAEQEFDKQREHELKVLECGVKS